MERYKKNDGLNPSTRFVEWDIVTYEDWSKLTGRVEALEVMVLDHIEPFVESTKGDIYFKTNLVFSKDEKPYLIPPNHLKQERMYRNWFNHDTLRSATVQEKELLIKALTQFRDCDKNFVGDIVLDIKNILNDKN